MRIAGLERVNPGLFEPLIEDQQDKPLDRERLDRDIQQIYGRSDFERISYRFEPQPNGSDTLIVDVVEKSWGPGYIGLGLGLSSDSRGDSRFGIRGNYRQTWLNSLGAEWNTNLTLGNEPSLYTELYQPLRVDGAAFVAPYFDFSEVPQSVFEGDQRVARYNVGRLRVGADLGTTLSGFELRAGPYFGRTDNTLDTGSVSLPEGGNTDSGVSARLLYDTLDSAAAPRSGLRFTVDSMTPLKALGSDVEYTRTLLTATSATSFGPHTVAGTLRAGTSFGSDMPYYDQFPLGGFFRLSGYANEQFRANDMAFAGLAYYRQVASLPPPLGRGLYLGASLEAGWMSSGEVRNPVTFRSLVLNPEDTRYGGSVFFGSDTWIGPAYLGLGLSGTGESTVYVLIGGQFQN